MIRKWRLHNFKSIKRDTEIEFGPLTIFAGANSVGKSTLIQSILLITQTLNHKVESRSLVLNGPLTKLGQFDDLRSVGSDSDQITIEWECTPIHQNSDSANNHTASRMLRSRNNRFYSVRCEIVFDSYPSSPQRELYQIQPRLVSCKLVEGTEENLDKTKAPSRIFVSRRNANGENNSLSFINGNAINIESRRLDLDFLVEIDQRGLDELTEDYVSAELVGCALRHFLPRAVFLKIDSNKEKALSLLDRMAQLTGRPIRRLWLDEETIPSQVIKTLEQDLKKRSFKDFPKLQKYLFSAIRPSGMSLKEWQRKLSARAKLTRAALREELLNERGLRNQLLEEFNEIWPQKFENIERYLPRGLMAMSEYLDFYFTNSVRYLGPLRDEPKALYPLGTPSDPMDVGVHGEFTAAVLELYKSHPVDYIPTARFLAEQFNPSTQRSSLGEAVTDWLHYLGIADSVKSTDRGKLGHELQVSLDSRSQHYDLTHVGVGVSQVLPILVSCLLAANDSTVILEQPEIHLHPRVQTLLGDFFLSMVLMNKQCVIETHSEYLINRLRYRAASAPLEKSLTPYLKIYFVEKRQGQSEFRQIEINEFGAVLDWPAGFFDQSQREAEETLRAAMRKKQELRIKEREKLG